MTCPSPLASTVSFQATAVTTLTLKLPDVGNQIDVDLNIRTNRGRGGTMWLTKRGSPIKTIPLSFSGLTKAEIDTVETFFAASAGKLLTYVDHHGTTRYGAVKTYRITDGRRELGFSVEFVFEVQS